MQNATDIITKCESYFITKCDISLLQNASGFSLQNAAVLLQNATVITKCDDFITKYNSYYKMRRLLQIATVHLLIAKLGAYEFERDSLSFMKSYLNDKW